MTDVARLAGVSHQTVSRVLNGHPIAPVEVATEALDDLTTEVPLVTIDGDPERAAHLVAVDQEAGGFLATRHLLDAGHQTVWHVCGPEGWYDRMGRISGWQRALTEAGAEIPPLLTADWSAASGYRAGQTLARMPEATAVFAANDHLALGIIRALNARGRRVPADVSLVGFDDVPEAEFYSPPLTTIRPDFEAVATASMDLLLTQIESGQRQVQRRIISPALIGRDSVAPPRAG